MLGGTIVSVGVSETELDYAEYEQFRDSVIIASRQLSERQLLELADGLHAMLRHRNPRTWEQARRGTSGFA